MRKGSVGIFALLVMMLVASVLFALLEATRCQEIRRLCNLQTQVALESAFANYDSMLWDEFGLLGGNITQLENTVVAKANSKASGYESRLNMLKFGVHDFETQGYTLITDGRGVVYGRVVAESMKETIFYGTAKEIFNQYEVIKQLEEKSSWSPLWITNGLSQEIEEVENMTPNPMKEAINIQNKGILELVVEDTSTISNKDIDLGNTVSYRTLAKGKNPVISENNWLDQVLLQQYILQNMSSFGRKIQDHSMDYEVEYLIGGKSSDIENLKSVVNQILFLREVSNFLYLTSNADKVEEAGIIALTIAGVSANPVIIEAVKTGIIAAWALAESVLDVRALLQGKKIALLKSDSTWTLEISHIGNVAEGYFSAKECENGLSYQEYLGILLLFLKDEELSMRAMDMQEATLRIKKEDSNFCMDELFVQARTGITYSASPVFLSFYQLDYMVPDIYHIRTEYDYSYY